MKLHYVVNNLNLWQSLISRHYSTENAYMRHLEMIRGQFVGLVQQTEDEIDLVEAALLIARTAFPDLVSSQYQERLDQWADRLRQNLGPSSSAGDIIGQLNRILFDEEGLQGDRENYYDPQNSFLNRVLERKLGIPITLSLVYSEVGRRAGLPMHGIPLPGHFIAALLHGSGTLYIDPFNRGEILSESECRKMIEARYGREAAADGGWKTPAGKKMVLKRMLKNLKGIYRQLNQELQAFEMLQWILAMDPDAPEELKERGLFYEAMGNNAFAARDLAHYLAVAPESADREAIESKISQLRLAKGWLH